MLTRSTIATGPKSRQGLQNTHQGTFSRHCYWHFLPSQQSNKLSILLVYNAWLYQKWSSRLTLGLQHVSTNYSFVLRYEGSPKGNTMHSVQRNVHFYQRRHWLQEPTKHLHNICWLPNKPNVSTLWVANSWLSSKLSSTPIDSRQQQDELEPCRQPGGGHP